MQSIRRNAAMLARTYDPRPSSRTEVTTPRTRDVTVNEKKHEMTTEIL